MIIDGREVAGYIKQRHQAQASGRGLKLVIVSTGNSESIGSFTRAKVAYGEDIGVEVEVILTTSGDLLNIIKQCNDDPSVSGVIVQLPLSDPEQTEAALKAVSPDKDIDGLTPDTLYEVSAVKGVLWLLASYNINLKNQVVAVVGQGRLVGKPLADRLESDGVNVKRYDDKEKDLRKSLLDADIIISATGVPGLIKGQMVKAGAIIIDAGSGSMNGRIVGDTDPELINRQDIKISPVPGGVGPMTVAALFDNLLLSRHH